MAKPSRQAVDSAAASASKLRVHFVPRWPRNPYHGELSKHLATFDVCVADESRLKDIAASRGRPDIVHLHALPPMSFKPAALLRQFMFWRRIDRLQRAGVKIVWTLHNVSDHESRHPTLDRMIARRCYRLADAIIVHSGGALQLVESQWRIQRRHNLFIVHHGHFIDCYPTGITRKAARSRLGVPDDALVFLFLGNIRPYKGVQQLVRDFKAVSTPRMRLIIAGEVLTDALRREIEAEIGGSETIDFRPRFVPDSEVQTYMTAADAVVFPYTKALTSGALILAMSFGRACIAPRIGALADTLDDQGGFFFEPTEGTSLRASLAAAIARASRLSAMGTHNRGRAAQWGWDKAARLTAAAYRACLTSSSDARKSASTSP